MAAHLGWVAWEHRPAGRGLQAPQEDAEAMVEDRALLRAALPPPGAGAGPDLVLVVVEGLRADHAAALPALGRWAQGAAAARVQAVAPSPEAAAASLATGLMPSEHRVSPDANARLRPLDPQRPTLAGRLGAAGWATVRLAATREDPALNLGQGFGASLGAALPEGEANLPYVPGDRMLALGRAALERLQGGPRALQLHLADPLSPWIPREGSCEAEGLLPRLLPPGGARARSGGGWLERRLAVLSGARAPTEAERAAWQRAYRCELAWLDAQLGPWLEALPALGVGPEDWVVVLGSFGQDLGEPGGQGALLEWGRGLGAASLEVPLWVRGPGLAPEALAGLVSVRALPGWLLAQLGLPGLDPSRAALYEALDPPVALAERTGPREEDRRHVALRPLREAEVAAWSAGERVVLPQAQADPAAPGLAGLAGRWARGDGP